MISLNTEPTDRIIGTYSTGEPGPLILAIGGIHGNEPSGIIAMEAVLCQLEQFAPPISGRFVALRGNLPALALKRRCLDEDLNRCFRVERVNTPAGEFTSSEDRQLHEIIAIVNELAKEHDDICFLDCHTTSSMTAPYISVNEHTESLHLARYFPLPCVVGLEKSIPGCFAEYCNNLNYRGFTVEGGQHDEPASADNHEAILWLLLAYSGAMRKEDIRDFDQYVQLLTRTMTDGRRHYRLLTHYRIAKGEQFRMCPGYVSFQQVRKGEVLATNRFGDICAPCDGRILMPLYQREGNDGFFLLEDA